MGYACNVSSNRISKFRVFNTALEPNSPRLHHPYCIHSNSLPARSDKTVLAVTGFAHRPLPCLLFWTQMWALSLMHSARYH
jgi:hypothetical protein